MPFWLLLILSFVGSITPSASFAVRTKRNNNGCRSKPDHVRTLALFRRVDPEERVRALEVKCAPIEDNFILVESTLVKDIRSKTQIPHVF